MTEQQYPYQIDGKDILFAYCEPIKGRYVTAGYRFNDRNNTIEATYTVCSKKDRYSKEEGRKEAMKKLAEGRFITVNPHITNCFSNYEKIMKCMRSYNKYVQKLPSRIVKAVVMQFK